MFYSIDVLHSMYISITTEYLKLVIILHQHLIYLVKVGLTELSSCYKNTSCTFDRSFDGNPFSKTKIPIANLFFPPKIDVRLAKTLVQGFGN